MRTIISLFTKFSVFSSLLSFIKVAWKYRMLLLSFTSFPKLPNSWKSSEEVRVFFIAFMRSDTAHEFVKMTPIKWDDVMRPILATLAEIPMIWDIRNLVRNKLAWRLAVLFRYFPFTCLEVDDNSCTVKTDVGTGTWDYDSETQKMVHRISLTITVYL